MSGVLVDSLIGVLADLSGVRNAEGPQRSKPFPFEVFDQAFAQDDLRLLVDPRLRNVQDEQHTAQLRKHTQLGDELGNVLVRQSVVERSVPGVEPDLRVGRRAYYRDEGDK